MGHGDSVEVRADKSPARFLLVSGKPLNEPIARNGPFVMNSQEEIQQTLRELQMGTFAASDFIVNCTVGAGLKPAPTGFWFRQCLA